MQLDNKVLLEQVEELAKILKDWNEQLVIGGGVALVLYDLVLSKANSGAVGTTDIDYLIPRKPVKSADKQISKILMSNGFEPKNKSNNHPSVQSFIKQVEEVEIEVEFLTDAKSRDNNDVVEIKEAGVNAQALSYIQMSLSEATPLELPNGEKITVVKPGAWVFYKGLTFTKRTNKLKKLKDLYGIWFVLTQLNDTSAAVLKALPKLMDKSVSSWKKTFQKNLQDWTANTTPQDWDLLTQQDISGSLSQTSFEKLIQKITA